MITSASLDTKNRIKAEARFMSAKTPADVNKNERQETSA
jgi:hypothetical protein